MRSRTHERDTTLGATLAEAEEATEGQIDGE
jgi:hypothetical protein